MAKPTVHIEKSRSWWNGSSTTLCGLTTAKVTVSGHGRFGPSVTRPACKTTGKGGR